MLIGAGSVLFFCHEIIILAETPAGVERAGLIYRGWMTSFSNGLLNTN